VAVLRRLGLVGLLVALSVPLAAAPGHADQVRDAQWHVDYLDLATAHQLSRGEGVTVAIIDSGVDASHPDLGDNLLPGVDLVDPDNRNAWTPEDHGTLVAGVLGGQGHGTGGGDGVLGVAPAATVLPIRATDDREDDRQQPSSRLVADGIRQAVASGAGVISVSLSSEYSEVDERAVAAARRADVVVVAAAGNRSDGEEPGGVTFPAALPTVLAVGGVDQDGGLAEFSVTGPELALTAPGKEIVTTRPGGEYAIASGTSFAAPIVAGAAALVRSRFPELTADEVIHRLVTTADDAGPLGVDEQYGHGVVDVVAALTAELPPMPPVADEPDQVRTDQWHLADLGLPAAHALTRGEGVTVAVVGSGVDATHPDLHRNLLPGIDLSEPEHDNAWTPTASGTALAGLVAGHGNRLTDHEPGNRGVLGVAPAATILPVRVNGADLTDREAAELAVEGIEWAVANGAQVICYAGPRASQDLFAGAVEAARAAGVVVVAGAGDEPAGGELWYPAANPAVLAVAPVDRDRAPAAHPAGITLAAPGVDLLTTAPADGYMQDSRTSAAAAVAAGAAALVRAAYPELSADEVVHRLVATADEAGEPGPDERYGNGILNPVEALTADVPPPTASPGAEPGGPGGGLAAPPGTGRDLGRVGTVVLVVAAAAVLAGGVVLFAQRRRRRPADPGVPGGPGHPAGPGGPAG
jgi:type VII secretion-associated serine protease mycosin